MIVQSEEMLINFSSSAVIGVLVIVIASIALGMYFKQKTKLMLYFFMAWAMFGAFIITGAVSVIIVSVLLHQISYVIILPANVIFWFAFVDYAMHENLGMKKIVVAFVITTFMASFIVLEPWTFDITRGIFTINPEMDWWFMQITNVVFCMDFIVYAYWTTITFRKSPPALKKSSKILFSLGIVMLFSAVIQFTGDATLLILQTILVIMVAFVTIIVIKKDPRIAHLLPYTVYRLLITSKNGPKYYSKTWAPMELDDDMLAGLLSAIRTTLEGTVKKAIKSGAISEVRMVKAVMLTEMRYEPINIVLLASRSSSALKNALAGFGEEFTKMFYDHFYTKEGFVKEVNDPINVFTEDKMESLIAKYFGIVPSFMEKVTADLPACNE
jgi:hypothetical protein